MLSLCDVKQQMQRVLKIRPTFIYSHTSQGMLQRYDRLQHSACLRAVQSKMQTRRNKPSWQERGFASSYGMINFVKDMPNKYYLLKANPLNYENKHGKKCKTQQNQTEKKNRRWIGDCIFTFLCFHNQHAAFLLSVFSLCCAKE